MYINDKEIKLSELEQRADEFYMDFINNPKYWTQSDTEGQIDKECDSLINSVFGKITKEQSDAITEAEAANEELGFIKGYIHAMRNMLKID